MRNSINTYFLYFLFSMFIGLNAFFLINATAQNVTAASSDNYTFETIEVPGVDFLALTASSDFEDYAGYTHSVDGEKFVAFTLIDGVYTTYDFPGAQNTYFYALGNNGVAAGHYEDSEGLFHGVILENGELRQFDFPDSTETEIYGFSDSTGALTGNFTDELGVRRGFSGNTVVEFPGATETYADFVSGLGNVVGSYVDTDGIYHAYLRGPGGSFATLDIPEIPNMEYFFLHGINDALVAVGRGKSVDGVPRTFVGNPVALREFKVPDSLGTDGWNINQDGSVVGHYISAHGQTHGFIARPVKDDGPQPVIRPPILNYTFESINVPGVDFLAVTASSDFFDYAGNMRSANDEKDVAFTLINGVFTTYDYPNSQGTYFYALGNDGTAAGHYKDSDGLFHGVILENGELRQYDFPNAVQTEIYGLSDATGALTGSFVDTSGVRRGFSGETIVRYPNAPETYADFVSWTGHIVGSYKDTAGVYHAYMRSSIGRFLSIDLPNALNLEYFFLHGLTNTRLVVGRAKAVGDVPRTYVGNPLNLQELQFPGAVSTEGWNINQDGSVVGHYDTADGRRHGFIARLVKKDVSDNFGNIFNVTLTKGLNTLSLPLATPHPMTAKSLAGIAGSTMVIALDAENQRFIGWTPSSPDEGFTIEGGQGYIVNVPETRTVLFVGAPWTNQMTNQSEITAAPAAISKLKETWAFIVSGHLDGKQKYDGYHITVKNLRTHNVMTTQVKDNYFAAATVDLSYRNVVQIGDTLQLIVTDTDGNIASDAFTFKVTPASVAEAVLSVTLDSIGTPKQSELLQNYPNPFNPETWIPYRLSEDSNVSITIYDATGSVVRTFSLGFQSVGFYQDRGRAVYWDGKNVFGESVASGLYFYQLTTESFQQTRRLIVVK